MEAASIAEVRARVRASLPRDLVVVAPGDAQHVNAYDRGSGALRWRAPHETLLRTRYGTLRQTVLDALAPRLPAGVHLVPAHPVAGTVSIWPDSA